MPEVTIQTGEYEIRREEQGVDFRVRDDGALIGTMRVSTGGVRFWASGQRNDGHFVSWTDFAEFMKGQPRR